MSSAAYRYRAARGDGVLECGSIEAASREAVTTELAARGLFPMQVIEEARVEAWRASVSLEDLAFGLHLLATLLESGLPMLRALQALTDLAPPPWQKALPSMCETVREGKSLASALGASPLSVPPLIHGIVQAGEAAGSVAEAVRRAAEIVESQHATRASLRNALTYPIILAVAGAGSVVFLVSVVLPRFASILADLGQTVPPTTRLALAAADVLSAAALPTVLALAAATSLWHAWIATPTGRERWHALLLTTPCIGPLRRSIATSRMSAALAALLESGLPIASALRHAAPAAGDAAITARLLAAREAVLHGQKIADALESQDALSPITVRLLRTGEEAGRLPEMLARASRLEREYVERRVQAGVKLVEPLLILLFGGLVALIAASLLQAVYSVGPGT